MHVNFVEIYGFKSFGSRTRIHLSNRVTMIVGPNGCGKSNILDAIRWVLGEQSARNLRGDVMEDVVFSGTDQRRPLPMAEVILSLRNEDGVLDIEADDVQITRRLHRSGESEYLINDVPVRLKDIHTLMMDTGLGKAAYAIIEQGKISQILSTRPDDRRAIFEEAAGITRFKVRKREAMRKLDETGQRLLRVDDLIAERERQVGTLAEQSERAKQYQALTREARTLDARIYQTRLATILRDAESHQKRVAKFQGQFDDLMAKERELETAYRQALDAQEAAESESRAHERRLLALSEASLSADASAREAQAKLDQLALRRRQAHQQRDELEGRLEALDDDASRQEDDVSSLESSFQTAEEDHATHQAQLVSLDESIVEARDQIDETRTALRGAKAELSETQRERETSFRKFTEDLRQAEGWLADFSKANPLKDTRQAVSDAAKALDIVARWLGDVGSAEQLRDAAGKQKMIDLLAAQREALQQMKTQLEPVESILGKLQSLLTQDESGFRRKADAEATIDHLLTSIDAMESKIQNQEDGLNELLQRRQQLMAQQSDAAASLAALSERKAAYERDQDRERVERRRLIQAMEDLDALLDGLEDEDTDLAHAVSENQQNAKEAQKQRTELEALIQSSAQQRGDHHEAARSLEHAWSETRTAVAALREKLERARYEQREGEIFVNALREQFREKYGDELEAPGDDALLADLDDLEAELADVRQRIMSLGQVNLLAIDEHDAAVEGLGYLRENRYDIVEARDNLNTIIEESDKASSERLIETVTAVQASFQKIFATLFGGGRATVKLSQPDEPLTSGIEISVAPPSKRMTSLSLMSGGEQALTALALMFSIFEVRPAPFCLLDEVDAPLDDLNIGRFASILRMFTDRSQFLIITHNRKTVVEGDRLYGVTMEEPGVTRVLSLEVTEEAMSRFGGREPELSEASASA